jgi:colanic acid/amylovoran biosynthesis glycosyltransferase
MPNLIMEASAAGIPVVSTDCGGSVELIEHSVTGYLVSPDDHAAMWTYLDSLLANPCQRHRMGQAAREKMLQEFSVSTMVTRMTQVYEQAYLEKGLL